MLVTLSFAGCKQKGKPVETTTERISGPLATEIIWEEEDLK